MPMRLAPVHPEGPRYAAPLLFVPGLWAGADLWRATAGYFAHRGWEGWLADVAEPAGGIAARAQALARVMGELERPPVLIAHDAGGVVALAAATVADAAAVAWVAPFLPGARSMRDLVSPWAVLRALVTGAPVPRPGRWAGPVAPAGLRPIEEAAAVVDAVRGRTRPVAPRVPCLLLASAGDPRSAPHQRHALAASLGAEMWDLPGAEPFPLACGAWQAQAGRLHVWLVRRLGAPLLELHDEAMAERDAEDTP